MMQPRVTMRSAPAHNANMTSLLIAAILAQHGKRQKLFIHALEESCLTHSFSPPKVNNRTNHVMCSGR